MGGIARGPALCSTLLMVNLLKKNFREAHLSHLRHPAVRFEVLRGARGTVTAPSAPFIPAKKKLLSPVQFSRVHAPRRAVRNCTFKSRSRKYKRNRINPPRCVSSRSRVRLPYLLAFSSRFARAPMFPGVPRGNDLHIEIANTRIRF